MDTCSKLCGSERQDVEHPPSVLTLHPESGPSATGLSCTSTVKLELQHAGQQVKHIIAGPTDGLGSQCGTSYALTASNTEQDRGITFIIFTEQFLSTGTFSL